MMLGLGAPELLIILVIIIAIFGASRLAGVGGAIGGSIREFKKAVRDEDPSDTKDHP
jgi:sec-independent protein translocase protein TatA